MKINRKSVGIRVGLISLMMLLLLSCQTDQTLTEADQEKDYHSKVQMSFKGDKSHIKYYGFSILNTYFDDPTDKTQKTDYTDEVSPFTNIADVLAYDPDVSIALEIQHVIDQGLKVYIHCFELFFELEGKNKITGGGDYKLRADYIERWEHFCQVSQIDGFKEDIAFLYLGEEAFMNGISFEELEAASDSIKTCDEGLKVMAIEAYSFVDSFMAPASIDYIGFDQYFVKDPQNDMAYISLVDKMLDKRLPHQKLFLIMDAHYIHKYHKDCGDIELDDMDKVALSYYELAGKYKDIVGIVGYFWPSGFDDTSSIGARNMPQHVIDVYKGIGNDIIHN